MDLSDFQRKAILFIFISILIGSILLARKGPLKEISCKSEVPTPQISPIPTKIDINTADISLIMQLPGVGKGLADQIIKHRPYSNLQDLLNVPGIGEKRLDRIKGMIDLPEGGHDSQRPALTMCIDLNKATAEQLLALPCIGPTLSRAIIDYREKHNRFNNLEELLQVPGIGKKKFEKIKEYLYVEEISEVNEVESNTERYMANSCISTKECEASPCASVYDSRIDPNVKCPYCGERLWEKGKRKQRYIRCPHCLRLLNE